MLTSKLLKSCFYKGVQDLGGMEGNELTKSLSSLAASRHVCRILELLNLVLRGLFVAVLLIFYRKIHSGEILWQGVAANGIWLIRYEAISGLITAGILQIRPVLNRPNWVLDPCRNVVASSSARSIASGKRQKNFGTRSSAQRRPRQSRLTSRSISTFFGLHETLPALQKAFGLWLFHRVVFWDPNTNIADCLQ